MNSNVFIAICLLLNVCYTLVLSRVTRFVGKKNEKSGKPSRSPTKIVHPRAQEPTGPVQMMDVIATVWKREQRLVGIIFAFHAIVSLFDSGTFNISQLSCVNLAEN